MDARLSSSISCRRTTCIRQHTSAYVSMRQHASACVSMRQHASACVSMRQHTSAYVSIRLDPRLSSLQQRESSP
jgi:hypothetical protein